MLWWQALALLPSDSLSSITSPKKGRKITNFVNKRQEDKEQNNSCNSTQECKLQAQLRNAIVSTAFAAFPIKQSKGIDFFLSYLAQPKTPFDQIVETDLA